MNTLQLALCTILMYGTWGILEKKALFYSSPYIYGLVFQIINIVVSFVIYSILIKHYGSESLKITDMNKFLIYTIFSVITTILAELTSIFLIKDNNAWYAITLIASYPVVTLVLSIIFLKESISVKSLIGVVLVVLGMIIM